MDNSTPSAAAPSNVNRTVPLRRANAELRSREYLTVAEIAALAASAKRNRWGHRDATIILMAFRHGFRARELCQLRRDQIDFASAVLHVTRVKDGSPSVHPLAGSEMRALRRLLREMPASAFVFVSERGAPISPAGS
jgi:type 1 fimbriae regulatory protein FimB/type 1 fimbriae regulatory protein FimE